MTRRDDAAGGRGKGVQAGRGDLREIPDRAELSNDGRPASATPAQVNRGRRSLACNGTTARPRTGRQRQTGNGHETLTGVRCFALLGSGAAGALARPYIANAAATTATVWWTQGFVPEEDVAFKKIVADYEKASGNTIDYSIVPLCADAPEDHLGGDERRRPRPVPEQPRPRSLRCCAWEDKLVDVSDVVETQKEEYTETALLIGLLLQQRREKAQLLRRALYTTAVSPNHIWRPLVEKAGYKIEDIPKTWDAFYDFFKDVQKKSARPRDAQCLRPRFPGDDQRRRSQRACSTIS